VDADLGTVLVTGGASGLGAAVVDAIARCGGTPVVMDRQPCAGRDVESVAVDLADTGAAEDAVRELVDRVDGIDAVVTCAGIDACGPFGEVARADWERVVAVNLFGSAAVVRAALPSLTARRGRVVTVASTLGLRALPDATAYCASKFGVVGFTRALAAELTGRVGVTLLLPGGMETPFFDGRTEQYRPPPDAVLNDPSNVAATVVFALRQPPGCELRELLVCPSFEGSWP
jgi:NAD(P)-dependent dehydrogenase (short-subunit alcohol dehydrogenase family)